MSFPQGMTTPLVNDHTESMLNHGERDGIMKIKDHDFDESYNGPSIVIECVKRKKKKRSKSCEDLSLVDDGSHASSRASRRSKNSRRSRTKSPKRAKSHRHLKDYSSGSSKESKEERRERKERQEDRRKALKRRASLDALTAKHAVVPTETLAIGLSDRHCDFESRLERAKSKNKMMQMSMGELVSPTPEAEALSNHHPTEMPLDLDLEEPTNTAYCQNKPVNPSKRIQKVNRERTTAKNRRVIDDWKSNLTFRHILDTYAYNPTAFDDHLDHLSDDDISLGELPEGCEESIASINFDGSKTDGIDEECPSNTTGGHASVNKAMAIIEASPQKRSKFRITMNIVWVVSGAALIILLVFLFKK